MTSRWIGFLFAILVGLAAGLYYAWVLNPVQYVDTTPESLRQDYQTDYVLMVAEIYAAEDDLQAAIQRLTVLGTQAPAERAAQAALFAERIGYTPADIDLLRKLANDLQGQP